MARPRGAISKRTPKYRHHKATGQAVVSLNGKDHYLGLFGSEESRRKYDRLVGEWIVRGRQKPNEAESITVAELIAAHWNHLVSNATPRPARAPCPTGHHGHFSGERFAYKVLRQMYGDTPVVKFGPLSLRAIQDKLKETKIEGPRGREGEPLSRNYINATIGKIRFIFRWGASMELVPGSIVHALATVPPLKRGAVGVREAEPIRPANPESIEVVLQHVAPTIRDMIQLQLLTGMRPTEVCIMRTCNIEKRGDMWLYRPMFHKTESRGRARVIPLGPRAQEIIEQRVIAIGSINPSRFLFSPADVIRESFAMGRSVAEYPNRQKSGRDRYYNTTYNRHVVNAIAAINKQRAAAGEPLIERFAPNQLRHSAATAIRSKYGLDAARALLGHSSANTTVIYADADTEKAVAAMREVG